MNKRKTVFLLKNPHQMQQAAQEAIRKLFREYAGQDATRISPLPPSGSNRQYARLHSDSHSAIGAFNPDDRENRAFLALSHTFLELGLPVPKVLAHKRDKQVYLVSDLGDTTLFSLLPHDSQVASFPEKTMDLYKKAIEQLPVFQIDAARNIDFSLCYPRHAFDRQSMMWDLHYFKYYFLKISGIPFDEQKLENDFVSFCDHLLQEPANYFMYRDFQSRNIMVSKGKPYFIDYQGGRKGPLPYDIASLLYDAKANIPFHQREELLEHYLDALEQRQPVDRAQFRRSFYDFVLMRILQAMGSYGFRGGVERKVLFLQSVPFALNNLSYLRDKNLFPGGSPYLCEMLDRIIRERPLTDNLPGETGVLPLADHLPGEAGVLPPPDDSLTVRICSFSYKKGIPADNSGNGGGFVFDCRALPNPGRQQDYRALTGKDAAVREYLEKDERVNRFLDASRQMVEPAVEDYIERGFTSLAVCFGCTGGQHRSVYCAEEMAASLRKKYSVHLILHHFEEDNWPIKKER